MYKCKQCGGTKGKWRMERLIESRVKVFNFKCPDCGNSFSFTKPYNPSEGAVARYDVRNDRRFLEINGKMVEVGLLKGFKKGKPYLEVVPVGIANYCSSSKKAQIKDCDK